MEEIRSPTPTGIVLAAGMATRMGAFKQLLPLGDRSVVEWVVDELCQHLERVVVVLGYRADEVAAALAGRPVNCAVNPDFRLGMSTSVQCGIRFVEPASAYLICLGDQPRLRGVLGPLLATAARSPRGIVIPTYQGKRGHPLFVRNTYVEEILALPPDQGLNTVTRRHRCDTLEVPVEEIGALEDLDTPADYQRALARHGGRNHG